jgi:hypothetical protein
VTNSPLFYHIQSLRERGTIPDNIGRLSLLQELEGKIQQVIGTAACSKIEKQIPVVAEPWWVPPNIRIADTAVKEHDEICKTQLYTHMKVYTDGIDIQGRGGAAAWEPHRRWKILVDIGPSDQFSVYGAELFGIWIALDMGVNAGDIVKKLTIFTENQASIPPLLDRERGSQELSYAQASAIFSSHFFPYVYPPDFEKLKNFAGHARRLQVDYNWIDTCK